MFLVYVLLGAIIILNTATSTSKGYKLTNRKISKQQALDLVERYKTYLYYTGREDTQSNWDEFIVHEKL